jgi:hypothetical protein
MVSVGRVLCVNVERYRTDERKNGERQNEAFESGHSNKPNCRKQNVLRPRRGGQPLKRGMYRIRLVSSLMQSDE